jgi:hypothetical protein
MAMLELISELIGTTIVVCVFLASAVFVLAHWMF